MSENSPENLGLVDMNQHICTENVILIWLILNVTQGSSTQTVLKNYDSIACQLLITFRVTKHAQIDHTFKICHDAL